MQTCAMVLGKFYFRVFRYQGWYRAFAKNVNADGLIDRSREVGSCVYPSVHHGI